MAGGPLTVNTVLALAGTGRRQGVRLISEGGDTVVSETYMNLITRIEGCHK